MQLPAAGPERLVMIVYKGADISYIGASASVHCIAVMRQWSQRSSIMLAPLPACPPRKSLRLIFKAQLSAVAHRTVPASSVPKRAQLSTSDRLGSIDTDLLAALPRGAVFTHSPIFWKQTQCTWDGLHVHLCFQARPSDREATVTETILCKCKQAGITLDKWCCSKDWQGSDICSHKRGSAMQQHLT